MNLNFTFQWTRDGLDIPGAVNTSYVVQPQDKGHSLFFRVLASNATTGLSTPATSLGKVAPASGPALTITGTPGPAATIGQPYSFTPTTAGGTAPCTFSMPSGTLPTGLTLNANTGAITGTPTISQTQSGMMIRATDHVGATDHLGPFSISTGISVTPATWKATVLGAPGGSVIVLQPGAYGDMRIDPFTSPGVTVSASPGAIANSLLLDTVSNIAWRGLEVTGLYGFGAVTAYGPSNISFDGFHIHGQTSGTAFSLVGGTNVSITNNEIDHIGSGVGVQNTDHLTISGNNLHDLVVDGVLCLGATHVTVSGNTIQSLTPQAGDHPDAIQFAASGAGPSDTVTVSGNIIKRGSGDLLQGIFIENTNNITINGNAMAGTMFGGIELITATNVSIDTNFVQGFTDGESRIQPRGCTNVSVTNNTAETITNGPEPNINYSASGNTIIPAAAIGDYSAMNAWLAGH